MMKMVESGIYEIVNLVNKHRYIGSAFDFKSRWILHRSRLRNNKHHSPYLQNAWNKYGEDCFSFVILETCVIEELNEREQVWINKKRPEYNMKHVVSEHHHLRQPTDEDCLAAVQLLHIPYSGRKFR